MAEATVVPEPTFTSKCHFEVEVNRDGKKKKYHNNRYNNINNNVDDEKSNQCADGTRACESSIHPFKSQRKTKDLGSELGSAGSQFWARRWGGFFFTARDSSTIDV